jgi:hypothetical protein
MKRSVCWLGAAAGSALLVAVGCSHRGREAQAPEPTPGSPEFESNVPPAAPTPMHPASPETPVSPPGQEQATPPAGPGAAPEPGAGPTEPTAPPAVPEQPAPTAGESERQLCDELANSAKIRVEEIKNGVAIVLSPKGGHGLAILRDDAHRTLVMMHQHPAEGAAACGLLVVGRMPSVTSSVSEGQKEVRIVLHAKNPAELKDLRRAAREEVWRLTQKPR